MALKVDHSNLIGYFIGKNFELLACLEFAHQSKMVLLDKAFSTRVPAILNDSAVLLVRNNSQQLPVLQKGVRRMAICEQF